MNTWKVTTIVLVVVVAATLVYFLGFSQPTALISGQPKTTLTSTTLVLDPNNPETLTEAAETARSKIKGDDTMSQEGSDLLFKTLEQLKTNGDLGETEGEVTLDGFWSFFFRVVHALCCLMAGPGSTCCDTYGGYY
ncbi:hypothetical protein ACFL0Z_03015 [Patescibacteria group bacterium]